MSRLLLWAFLLCTAYFGQYVTRAQGIYFENTSLNTVGLEVTWTHAQDDWVYVQNGTHEVQLLPSEFLYLDGNIFYDDLPEDESVQYTWVTYPLVNTYSGGSSGYIGKPDLQSHYQNFGAVARVSVTRTDEELAVGRAIIQNTSAVDYQFQGQVVPAGEFTAFLTPANTSMWNTVWDNVNRFGAQVVQPDRLQFQARPTLGDNFRNLDWQEKMMWWGGMADPVQWAWWVWDGQTFNHLGNELQGDQPPNVNAPAAPTELNPNWPNVLTGNNNAPVSFLPTGSNAGGGGGNGNGGGNGGGGNGGGGGGNGNGGGNGAGGNGGGGAIFVEIPDDYAREPTLQDVRENTEKIRQHTWGTNQRLNTNNAALLEIRDILSDEGTEDELDARINAELANMDGLADGARGEVDNLVAKVNDDWAFLDLLMNNLPLGEADLDLKFGGNLLGGAGGGHVIDIKLSPREEPWATLGPWCKGILSILLLVIVMAKLYAHADKKLADFWKTPNLNGNIGIWGLTFGADGIGAVLNVGITFTAFATMAVAIGGIFAVFVAGPCFTEITNFISTALAGAGGGGGGGSAATGIAVGLDWAFHFLPIMCGIHLLIMYATGRTMISAMSNMGSVAKTAASA